jgi:hypothetical protein
LLLLPTLYVLLQDGKPIQRGLSYPQACRMAEHHAQGYKRGRENEKRRIPAFDVRPDEQLLAESNANYRAYKEGERISG